MAEGGALREIFVALGFDLDEKSEKGVLEGIETIKHAAMALGAAFGLHEAYEAIYGTAEQVAHLGDEAVKTAQKVGVSAEAIQKLGYAAKLNGASQEEMVAGLRVLSRTAYDAAHRSGELHKDFQKLGVSVTDASGRVKPAEQLFGELADGFSKMTNETERTALAQKVLGRGGTALIPLLSKGGAEIAELSKQAEELGLVMSGDLLKASVDFEDAEIRQTAAIQGAKNAFAEELLPTLTKLKDRSTKFIVHVLRPMVKILGRALAKAIHVVDAAMHFVLKTLRPVIGFFERLTAGLGGTVDIADILAAAITGLAALLAAKSVVMAVAWAIANAPLLLTIALIALIGTAIGLLIEDLMKWGDGSESVTGTLVQGVQDLYKELGSIPAVIASMLDTAKKFWGDFFSDVLANGKGLWADLFRWLADQVSGFTQIWIDLFNGKFLDAIKDIGKYIFSIFKMPYDLLAMGAHALGIGSDSPATSSDVGGAAAGGASFNHGGNDVTINVSGVSAPGEVAKATSDGVRSVMEDDQRMSMQSFSYAGATP